MTRMIWQDRVVDEQKNLQLRLDWLRAFLEAAFEDEEKIPPEDRDRLFRQGIAMREYNDILLERIENFPTPF